MKLFLCLAVLALAACAADKPDTTHASAAAAANEPSRSPVTSATDRPGQGHP